MSSVLAAGLVPNDPSKAAHNSNKLANLRASHNTIRWDSDVSSGTAVYHLQDSVSMKPRESWIGDGMKAVRALFQGNGVILEDNCNIRDMSLSGTARQGIGVNTAFAPNDSARRWSMTNCHVDLFDIGINCRNCIIVHLDHVYLGGNFLGLKLDGEGAAYTNALYYRGGEIWRNHIGIDVSSVSTTLKFSELTIEANHKYGINFSLNNRKRSASVTGCYFEGSQTHLRIDSVFEPSLLVSDNYFSNHNIEWVRGNIDWVRNEIK